MSKVWLQFLFVVSLSSVCHLSVGRADWSHIAILSRKTFGGKGKGHGDKAKLITSAREPIICNHLLPVGLIMELELPFGGFKCYFGRNTSLIRALFVIILPKLINILQ